MKHVIFLIFGQLDAGVQWLKKDQRRFAVFLWINCVK